MIITLRSFITGSLLMFTPSITIDLSCNILLHNRCICFVWSTLTYILNCFSTQLLGLLLQFRFGYPGHVFNIMTQFCEVICTRKVVHTRSVPLWTAAFRYHLLEVSGVVCDMVWCYVMWCGVIWHIVSGIIWYCTVLYCTAWHGTHLHCTALSSVVLYCITLYCIILYYIMLCCVVLCCVRSCHVMAWHGIAWPGMA